MKILNEEILANMAAQVEKTAAAAREELKQSKCLCGADWTKKAYKQALSYNANQKKMVDNFYFLCSEQCGGVKHVLVPLGGEPYDELAKEMEGEKTQVLGSVTRGNS